MAIIGLCISTLMILDDCIPLGNFVLAASDGLKKFAAVKQRFAGAETARLGQDEDIAGPAFGHRIRKARLDLAQQAQVADAPRLQYGPRSFTAGRNKRARLAREGLKHLSRVKS